MTKVRKQFEWIFLDIDGVLAPDGRYDDWNPQTIEELCSFDKKCLNLLEEVLRKYPAIPLALASCWKEQFTFEQVKTLFSQDIRTRVVDYTPFPDSTDAQGARRREIALFLEQRGAVAARWLAVSSVARHFNPRAGDETLIVKSAHKGFSEDDAQVLDAVLAEYALPPQLTLLTSVATNSVVSFDAPDSKSVPIPVISKALKNIEMPRIPNLDALPMQGKNVDNAAAEAAKLRVEAMQKLQHRTTRLEQIISKIQQNVGIESGLLEARDILHTLTVSLGFIGLAALGQRAHIAELAIDDALQSRQLGQAYVQFLVTDIKGFVKHAKPHLTQATSLQA